MIHEDPKSGKLKTKILALMLEKKGIQLQQNSHEIEDIKMQLNNGTCKSFKIRDSIICTMDNKI